MMECSLRINGNVLIFNIKDIVFKVEAERKYDEFFGDSVMAYYLFLNNKYLTECTDGFNVISMMRRWLYKIHRLEYRYLKQCIEQHIDDILDFCSRMAMLSSRE